MLVLRPYPITRGDEHTTRELVIYKILCSQKKMTAPVIEDVSPVNAALAASAAPAWSILGLDARPCPVKYENGLSAIKKSTNIPLAAFVSFAFLLMACSARIKIGLLLQWCRASY
jgi:hypothetical protein